MAKAAKPKTSTETRRHDLPPLSLRAAVRPDTVDEEKRTVEIVWSTGARVLRGYFNRYYEELSLDRKHVRLDRLNNGAPFLDAHNGFELGAVIGVVEKASVDGKQGTATIRFAKAEDDENADRIFRKVRDGIIQNISVGYRVHKFEQVEGGDEEIPVYRATDWEPFELSAVPMGADDGAGFRNATRGDERYAPNPCEFVTRSQETTAMDEDEKKAAAEAEAKRRADELKAAEEKARKEATEAATKAERERVADIDVALRAVHIDDVDFRKELVDGGVAIDDARKRILERKAAETESRQIQSQVRVGDDLSRAAMRDGMQNALLHRAAPHLFKLEEVGRVYRGMTLMEMAREAVEASGLKTRGMAKMDLAGHALGLANLGTRAGYHSTSDFPLLLADLAGKMLRASYMEAPQTFQPISRRTTAPDFKQIKKYQVGEAPQLLAVPEGAEFTRGTMGEAREVYSLATYGRVVAFTRQLLINDDLDAFSRLTMLFGRSARDLESDLVWSHFTSNPVMGDGVALFNAAHGNVGTGVIGIAGIGAGRAAMRQQKGLDGKQYISVQARYLLVPTALETTAEQFVSTNLMANKTEDINVFAGRLQVISEPRLDATSAEEFYLVADPASIDTIEIAYLEGAEQPFFDSRVGFDVDGVELKVRHDFAVKAIDWRGFYQSDGQPIA